MIKPSCQFSSENVLLAPMKLLLEIQATCYCNCINKHVFLFQQDIKTMKLNPMDSEKDDLEALCDIVDKIS